jgi:nitroimidazol reductase NimA-like FMN-containing flavoprotein (pyridoxamine 5'-phosphate oxidase superfamily)
MKLLTGDQARTLLESARVVRLGCVMNGEPYVVPINCYVEDDALYSHSLPGMKIDALRSTPRACVQVDEIDSDLRWRSVIAFGAYEEIRKPNERADVMAKLLRRFPMLTPVESALVADGSPPEVIVFRLNIERLTGLAEG